MANESSASRGPRLRLSGSPGKTASHTHLKQSAPSLHGPRCPRTGSPSAC